MIITRFGEAVWAVCARGGEEHGHGGVEGLRAQRVSEWQTGWPFSTLRWQTLIRGNYKGPLARSDLILLRRWEPNVIMALTRLRWTWAERKQAQEPSGDGQTANLSWSPGRVTKVLLRNPEPPVSCSVFAPPLPPRQNVHIRVVQSRRLAGGAVDTKQL